MVSFSESIPRDCCKIWCLGQKAIYDQLLSLVSVDLAFGLALAFPAFFFLFKPANNPFAAASPGIGTQVGKFKTFDMFPKPQPFGGNHISTSIVIVALEFQK